MSNSSPNALRLRYENFVKKDAFREGLSYFAAYTNPKTHPNEWAFHKRLLLDLGLVKEVIDSYNDCSFLKDNECLGHPALTLIKGFVLYYGERFQDMDLMLRKLKLPEAGEGDGLEYNRWLRVQKHLLMAKGVWRRDLFLGAKAHLAQASYHWRKLTHGDENLRGTIFLIKTRMLVRRKGRMTVTYGNLERARQLLREAKKCFEDENSLFMAGYYELMADIERLEAISKPNEDGTGLFYENHLEAAMKIFKQHAEKHEYDISPHRLARLKRLEGLRQSRIVLKHGRNGKMTDKDRQVLCDVIKMNEKEKAYYSKTWVHPKLSLAKVRNNLSLNHLLLGYSWLPPHTDKSNHLRAMIEIDESLTQAKEAFLGLGYDVSAISKRSEIDIDLGPQLLSCCCRYLEAKLCQARETSNVNLDVFQDLMRVFGFMCKVENELLKIFTSADAWGDMLRRNRPAYEIFLELFYTIKNRVGDIGWPNRSKYQGMLVELIHRSVAPQSYPFRKKHEDSPSNARELFVGMAARQQIRRLECDSTKEPSEMPCNEQPTDISDRGAYVVIGRWLEEPEGGRFTRNTLSPTKMISASKRKGEVVVSFFRGNRAIYALVIDAQHPEPIRLVCLQKENDYFEGVSKINKLILSLTENVTELSKDDYLDELTGFIDSTNDKIKKNNYELIERLQDLHKQVIVPLALTRGQRLVIMPDRNFYYIPWQILSTGPQRKGKNTQFRDYDYLIDGHPLSLQTSLENWFNRKEKSQEPQSRIAAIQTLEMSKNSDHVVNRTEEVEFFRKALNKMTNILQGRGVDESGRDNPKIYARWNPSMPKKSKDNLQKNWRNYASVVIIGHAARTLPPLNSRPSFIFRQQTGNSDKVNVLEKMTCSFVAKKSNEGISRILLLMCYAGGDGTVITGSAPENLATAFVHTGVPVVMYNTYRFNDHVAAEAGKQYFGFLRSGNWDDVNAYQEMMRSLKNAQENEGTNCANHIISWGGLQIIA